MFDPVHLLLIDEQHFISCHVLQNYQNFPSLRRPQASFILLALYLIIEKREFLAKLRCYFHFHVARSVNRIY